MASRQSKLVFGLSFAVVLAMLGGLAIVLANSQSSDRSDIEERFSRRPQVSAALTSALFSATSTTPEQQEQLNRRYGGETVSTESLTRDARENNSVFKAVLDGQGELIAISSRRPVRRPRGASIGSWLRPNCARRRAARCPHRLPRPRRRPANVHRSFAQPIETDSGRRILVTGFPPELLAAFLGQTLADARRYHGRPGVHP